MPGISHYEIAHVTLYKVHQRVAKTFQHGRAFLAGDAAHINNPLGGMGMNGGIHDAINLTARMVDVWHGTKPTPNSTVRPAAPAGDARIHREAVDPEQAQPRVRRDRVQAQLREIAADKAEAYAYLLRVSMIASLRRAQELG